MYIIAFGYKKNNPARRAGEKNNHAPKLSEKNLARKKIPSPPPQNIKWTVPNEVKHPPVNKHYCKVCRISQYAFNAYFVLWAVATGHV